LHHRTASWLGVEVDVGHDLEVLKVLEVVSLVLAVLEVLLVLAHKRRPVTCSQVRTVRISAPRFQGSQRH
jgi:hypothetical protein